MKPEVANRRIESFGKRFGEAHLVFAYHAAFPLALTPDLLYKLWANFQRDIHGRVLGIPWVAVADLLLSSLCEEVGHELYEMDAAMRNLLLSRLKEDVNFGQQRINELSDFLLAYVQQQLNSVDPDVRNFAQVQRWTALAYVRPSEVASELRLALEKVYQQDRSEQFRLASLVETFAEPLSEFEPLLVYAREMEKQARSNVGKINAPTNEVLSKNSQSTDIKLVIFNFESGDFETGFTVKIQIRSQGNSLLLELNGKLPSNPDILLHYNNWQSKYISFCNRLHRLEKPKQQPTNESPESLRKAAQLLENSINNWLNYEAFSPIISKLYEKLSITDKVRVLITTTNQLLRRLPWNLWDLFKDYPKAEFALSQPTLHPLIKSINPRNGVRILAIFSDNINPITNVDERTSLEQLPYVEKVFLIAPTRQQFSEKLQDAEGWDIFFFAGIASESGNGTRRLYINENDTLEGDELKTGLTLASKQGLKLAIFSTCEGLGLVSDLADLGIPTIITFRDVLPIIVAEEFLKHFLETFKSGQSLYTSVRQTRERLKQLEDRFPCSSWLPTIVQNPDEAPPTWQGLLNRTTSSNKSVSVDYAKLENLLKEGNWREADKETTRLMLHIVGREQEGYFDDVSQIENLPSENLQIINDLWLRYSNERFGFSVQKRIYQSLGGTQDYNRLIWENFGESVGWRKDNKWLLYIYLDFSTNAPKGCYPAQVLRAYEAGGVWVVNEFSGVFFSRTEL